MRNSAPRFGITFPVSPATLERRAMNDRRPFVAQKFSPLLTAKVHTVALRVITSSRDYRIAPPQLEPAPAVQPKQ